MPLTRKEDCKVAAMPSEKKKHSAPNHITALPQTLLEKILFPNTSRQDKRSSRQTCKLFQKILDNSLTCLRIKAVEEKCLPSLQRLLQRSNHVPTLKTVTVSGRGVNKDMLFRSIPKGIETLRIRGSDNNLEHLTGLSCLTALFLENTAGNTTGIEHISGLTYLRCHTFVDSVAHLAPTLKHLNVWSIGYVLDLDKLTNLERLEVFCDMPINFFETHRQLPLKHLSLFPFAWKKDFITNASAWLAAPTTLARLRISDASLLHPGVLPATITHLQLLNLENNDIEKIAAALPWLSNLDLFLHLGEFDWSKVFSPISKLQKLQCLGLWVTYWNEDECTITWPRQQVVAALSAVPAVAAAVIGGLKLNIVEKGGALLGAEYDRIPAKATWAAHAEVVVLA